MYTLKPVNRKPSKTKLVHESVTEAQVRIGDICDGANDVISRLNSLTRDERKFLPAQDYAYVNSILIKRLRRKRDDEDICLSLLVDINMGLIQKIVSTYSHNDFRENDRDDLVQEGIFGLLTAIEKFDFSFDTTFSTYATPWIRQRITRYLANSENSIRIPVHCREKLIKAYALMREREAQNLPTNLRLIAEQVYEKEIAGSVRAALATYKKPSELQKKRAYTRALDRCTEQLTYLINIDNGCASLDAPIQGNEDEDLFIGDFVADSRKGPEETAIEQMVSEKIAYVINHYFTRREADILRCRFGFGTERKTLREIGENYNLSRERIRQIEENALRKLRKNPKIKKELAALYK